MPASDNPRQSPVELDRRISNLESGIRPWHENKLVVALLTAAIAAMPPLTAGIYGAIQGYADYNLEKQKSNHQIRTYYLEKAIETKNESNRSEYIRFLASIATDPNLRNWAEALQMRNNEKLQELAKNLTRESSIIKTAQSKIKSIENSMDSASLNEKPNLERQLTEQYSVVSSGKSRISQIRPRLTGEPANEIFDKMVATLRHEQILAIKESGADSTKAKNIGEALRVAYEYYDSFR